LNPPGDPLIAPFKTVLLATQGTEYDVGAERVGIELAARLGIGLRVVLPIVSNAEYETMAPLLGEQAELEAAARLEALRQAARAKGVDLTGRVRSGEEPFREIVGEAREIQADLIVLRRRGRRGYLAKLLLGEMVQAVMGHAPCDVLTVPQDGKLWSRGVLVATDGSPHSGRVADVAASISVACGLPLTVVSVALQADAAQDAKLHVEQVLAAVRAAGAQATGRVVDGRPHEAILVAADEAGADLIVVGRRGTHAFKRKLVGSTSEKVAGQASAPVLIVRDE
jgi:nucleotide-binding universal stress UspA family protein